MHPVFRAGFCTLIICLFSCCLSGQLHAQEAETADNQVAAADSVPVTEILYSIMFGWKTEGSHELLAKKAAAIKKLKTPEGIAISFGSLLGPTRIVSYDNGIQFLRSAYQAGIEFAIPGAGEFVNGVDTFKILVEFSQTPRYISANLVDEKNRYFIVDPFAMWYVSGLRICLIGMSDMSLINDSPDDKVTGIDVLTFDEALAGITNEVAMEYPDLVIVAGKLDRQSIREMTQKYPFIDAFITNYPSGGFSDKQETVTTVFLADRPVYIASGSPDHLGRLETSVTENLESRVLTDITLGDEYSPDPDILAPMQSILDELKQKDFEESVIKSTGKEIASILRDIYSVDVALIERQSLFYYPISDSLDLLDVRKVIRSDVKPVMLSLKGSDLKSIWEKSSKQKNPSLRLHGAGITDDGKVDTIPVQDDRDYTVITTPFLRKGGNGYEQFTRGFDERAAPSGMIKLVENYLVRKEERIRIAEKKKIWDLALNIKIGTNLNKADVDKDKSLYGGAIPKPFKDYNDSFTGLFSVESWNNTLNVNLNKHIFQSKLNAKYLRSGYRTEDGDIKYKEPNDDLQSKNLYTYNLSGFKVKPYLGVDVYSELYSPGGRHPITASARGGVTREIKTLWNLVVQLGLHGTRNYTVNENSFGTSNKLVFNKSFPAKGLLTTPTIIYIDAQVDWSPMAKYHMAFYLQNNNRVDITLWKKLVLTFHVRSYSYRDTRHRKVAMGFNYDFTLNYKMDWKF